MVNIPNTCFPSLKVFKALAQLADLPFTLEMHPSMTMSVLSSQNVLQYYSLQRIMSQCYFHESNATSSSLNKDFPRNVRNLFFFFFQGIKYNRIIQSPEVVFTVYQSALLEVPRWR